MKQLIPLYILVSFLLIVFGVSPLHTMAEPEDNATLHYVAIGDSLAEGYLNETSPPDYTIGDGYPVFIQQEIEQESLHIAQLDNFGVGGFTTEDVLHQLENDDGGVRDSLENADVVTLDAGANDILQEIDVEEMDLSDPEEIKEAVAKATEAIEGVQENTEAILEEIKDLNSEVPVYVMEYYNALPYEDNQEIVNLMIEQLNDAINAAAEDYDVAFIPTIESFDGEYETYLPNPDNIHPTEEGYEVIANLFLKEIIPELPKTPEEEALEAVDDVDSIEEMQEALENEYLGLDLENYNELDDEDQNSAADQVLEERPGEGYSDNRAVQDVLNEAVEEVRNEIVKKALDAVTNAGNAEELQNALENEDMDLDLEDYYELDEKGQETAVNQMLKNHPDKGYSDAEAVQKEMDEAVKEAKEDDESGSEGKENGVWFSGEGDPADGTGDTGDFYLNEETDDYFKKTENGWVEKGNLRGKSGDKGDQGPAGDCKCNNNDDKRNVVTTGSNGSDGDSSYSSNVNTNDNRETGNNSADMKRISNMNGEELPYTASNIPFFLLIGGLLAITGGVLVFIYHKKVQR